MNCANFVCFDSSFRNSISQSQYQTYQCSPFPKSFDSVSTVVMETNVLTDYPKEVLEWMRKKEERHPKYCKASPQLSVRGSLVDFIRHVCETLKLSVLTTHLGVHLLDRFMDCHKITNYQLRLTALTVIFLAGTVTAAHFVEVFLMYGITPEDFIEEKEDLPSASALHRRLWHSTQHYLDMTLQDAKFLQWKSSGVAAACMVCGRMQTRILPTWPQTLEKVTGYSLNSLAPIIDTLLRLKELEETTKAYRTQESGYQSGRSSLQASPTTPQKCTDKCI
ncbi:Cyclin-J [Armadillidium vulgare]|nr:Cyclin-J [Armadillidium vulgare]